MQTLQQLVEDFTRYVGPPGFVVMVGTLHLRLGKFQRWVRRRLAVQELRLRAIEGNGAPPVTVVGTEVDEDA